MLDLFRMEVDGQAQALTVGLLALERDPVAADQLERCMRAAHSLKGAARIVGLDAGVHITHAMEDCFVAAQQGDIVLDQEHIDELLRGVDLLQQMAATPEKDMERWGERKLADVTAFLDALNRAVARVPATREIRSAQAVADTPHGPSGPRDEGRSVALSGEIAAGGQAAVLKVTAENLNRLLGLAGESLVESRGFKSFADSLLRLKRLQHDLQRALDRLSEQLPRQRLSDQAQAALTEARRRALDCRQFLAQRLVEMDSFDRRAAHLSHRLYDGALACHLRPFGDGVQAFPRMVRDLARTLGKHLRLDIAGEDTQVDRNILDKLEAPLGHLLRNALDHGIESPEERLAAGKPAEAVLSVEARHNAGRLQVSVADDGRGIDLERLRTAVIERKLSSTETAARLNDAELLEFLFLPGFSMKESITDISGRGVGLDVVQTVLKQIRGTVRIIQAGGGFGTRQLALDDRGPQALEIDASTVIGDAHLQPPGVCAAPRRSTPPRPACRRRGALPGTRFRGRARCAANAPAALRACREYCGRPGYPRRRCRAAGACPACGRDPGPCAGRPARRRQRAAGGRRVRHRRADARDVRRAGRSCPFRPAAAPGMPAIERAPSRLGERRLCLIAQALPRQLLAQAIQSALQVMLQALQPQQRVGKGFESARFHQRLAGQPQQPI